MSAERAGLSAVSYFTKLFVPAHRRTQAGHTSIPVAVHEKDDIVCYELRQNARQCILLISVIQVA